MARYIEIKKALAGYVERELKPLEHMEFEGHEVEVSQVSALVFQVKATPLAGCWPEAKNMVPRYFNVKVSEMM